MWGGTVRCTARVECIDPVRVVTRVVYAYARAPQPMVHVHHIEPTTEAAAVGASLFARRSPVVGAAVVESNTISGERQFDVLFRKCRDGGGLLFIWIFVFLVPRRCSTEITRCGGGCKLRILQILIYWELWFTDEIKMSVDILIVLRSLQ